MSGKGGRGRGRGQKRGHDQTEAGGNWNKKRMKRQQEWNWMGFRHVPFGFPYSGFNPDFSSDQIHDPLFGNNNGFFNGQNQFQNQGYQMQNWQQQQRMQQQQWQNQQRRQQQQKRQQQQANPKKQNPQQHRQEEKSFSPRFGKGQGQGQPAASTSTSSTTDQTRPVSDNSERSRIDSFHLLGDLLEEDIKVQTGDVFSKKIYAFYERHRQRREDLSYKIGIWRDLDEAIRTENRQCRTQVFGSTLTGFGRGASDLDMCIFNDKVEVGKKRKSNGRDPVSFLASVRRLLKRRFRNSVSDNVELIPAKVPILKFHIGGIEVDLSCNSEAGARNTHLLFAYGRLDWRVAPLVLAIKSWAVSRDINDASMQSLSSFAITLLVINYLQCGVKPPVLSVLQSDHPQVFREDSDIFSLPFVDGDFGRNQSQNKMCLGDLLRGFFRHYSRKFDFSCDAASVRTGKILNISDCQNRARDASNKPGQWDAYICAEEPFDLTNAARATVNREMFDRVLEAFNEAADADNRTLAYEIGL